MKPTKMRNRLIHQASNAVRDRQVGAPLSGDLRKKYGRRAVRLAVGDSIRIVRGEFSGVEGKVSKVSVDAGTVAIEGIKKEKTKGDKFDVYIHASNVLVTSLNTDDWWRTARLEGKDPKDRELAEQSRGAAGEAGEEQDYDEDDEDGREEDGPGRAGPEGAKGKPAGQKDGKPAGPEGAKKSAGTKGQEKKQKDKKRQRGAEEDDDYDEDDYEEDDD